MKDVIVAKFGGSSLADGSQFMKVKDIIAKDSRRRYIIPSAPGKRYSKDHKITDLLYMCHQLSSHRINFDEVYAIVSKRYEDICIELGLNLNIKDILSEIKARLAEGASRDYAASRGEYLNAVILSEYLGYKFVDASEIIVFDNDNNFDLKNTTAKVKKNLEDIQNAVIPGFYGENEKGEIITFSRGGSDITGSIIASAIGCELYENWTDVSGFLMADPKIVNDPKPIKSITYKELRELSYMGAPVLHEEAVFPIKHTGIPVNIKNTNFPEHYGTMIVDDLSPATSPETITGISGKKNFTVISIEKTMMSSEKGFLRKLISVMESNDVPIEHMPSSIDSISLVIADSQLGSKLDKIIEEIRIYCKPDSIVSYTDMALVAVVGRGMIRTKGVSAKVFTALSNEGINIRMITQGSSELNIIVGVENADFNRAISAIYQAFESENNDSSSF